MTEKIAMYYLNNKNGRRNIVHIKYTLKVILIKWTDSNFI